MVEDPSLSSRGSASPSHAAMLMCPFESSPGPITPHSYPTHGRATPEDPSALPHSLTLIHTLPHFSSTLSTLSPTKARNREGLEDTNNCSSLGSPRSSCSLEWGLEEGDLSSSPYLELGGGGTRREEELVPPRGDLASLSPRGTLDYLFCCSPW